MTTGKPGSDDLQPIADIDRTIHAPARLLILATLYVVESADFLFVMRQTGLTRGNLSSHMVKLYEEGYIDIKKEFVGRIPRTILLLTRKGRKALQEYRKNMKHVLDDLLG